MRCLVVVDPGHSLASSTRVIKPIQGLGERGIKSKILLKTRKWQRVRGGHSGGLVSRFHEQGKLEGGQRGLPDRYKSYRPQPHSTYLELGIMVRDYNN